MQNLYINGRYLSGSLTAVNATAAALSQSLVQVGPARGWEVALCVPPSLEAEARLTGLPTRPHGKRAGILWEQLDLPKLRHDGVVLGLFNTVPLWGTGYATMLHDAQVFTVPQSYGRPTRLWRQTLSRRAGHPKNTLFTVSEYSKTKLLDHGIGQPERIGVVHNALGSLANASADPGVEARLGEAAGRPFALAMSTLEPHKNIGTLLRAFEEPELADQPLVLFGRTTKAEFEAAGTRVPDNVQFVGYVTEGELAHLYEIAGAVCVPSLEEGFGMPALEGMSRGAPVIVSTCGALREVVAEAGIIVDTLDEKAWAAAILACLRDPDQQKQRRSASRARARTFSWTASAQAVFDCLDKWYAPS